MHISPNTVVLKDLQKLLQSLKSQLSLIAMHAKGLVDLIQWFESHEVRVYQTYNKVAELINTYRAIAQELHSTDAAINKLCVKSFHDISEKLTNYYNPDHCKKKPCFFQPAHNFLMAVRIFDPQVCSLGLEALPLYSIPGFDAGCKSEMDKYLPYAKENGSRMTLNEFWIKAEELFPNLTRKAKIYLSVVTNSVDAERSVSSHGQVFTEQRQSMKEGGVN
ncbi:UNVERIFIED_CONTAM: hypothetical protein FKN15_055952 [Acipenser sinensis]